MSGTTVGSRIFVGFTRSGLACGHARLGCGQSVCVWVAVYPSPFLHPLFLHFVWRGLVRRNRARQSAEGAPPTCNRLGVGGFPIRTDLFKRSNADPFVRAWGENHRLPGRPLSDRLICRRGHRGPNAQRGDCANHVHGKVRAETTRRHNIKGTTRKMHAQGPVLTHTICPMSVTREVRAIQSFNLTTQRKVNHGDPCRYSPTDAGLHISGWPASDRQGHTQACGHRY